MNSEKLAGLILGYLSGNISSEDEAALLKWREASSDNERIFQKITEENYLESEYAAWRAVDTRRPMMEMRKRIRRSRRAAFGRFASYASGACVCVAVGVLLGVKFFGTSAPPSVIPEEKDLISMIEPGTTKATLTTTEGEVYNFSDPLQAEQVARKRAEDRARLNNLEIPRGGEFHITLEDGTEVWLNAQTSLKYPEVFSDTVRIVEISGEGYFKVAKDSSRPFIVRTAGQIIRVYGTEFNINSYEDDEEVLTTLVEGSISLTSDGHPTNELLLAPGHQAVFSKAADETTIKTVDTQVVTSWRNDMFVFDDLTLDKIMRQLSRWYDFDYKFGDKVSSQIVFKGRIPRYGKFGDALLILEKSGGLNFEVEDKTIIISKKVSV